jgi:hypothetical protein
MPAEHKFLRFILPARAFAAIRAGTREWLIECPCVHKRDLWDVGGVRCKAAGEPRQYHEFPECGRGRWHKIRKKTDLERQQL